ncbi:MAG: haloacid dehalogenase-like hydrolase [Hyphomicrobiaceae bacterium]|nr:haloacid dehalogenase-like hydrolase [Hyphomicrobiaceae bacterium]
MVKCQYDASPESALAALQIHDGPAIVDFDETLYLRNSTEDYIDCAWPGLFALFLLRLLDLVHPWRLTGHNTRDTWRVLTVTLLMPWTRWRWRARTRRLAASYTNRQLADALSARAQPPIILTAGYRPIVRPLAAAMGFAGARLLAARTYSFADRRNGKLHMVTKAVGPETMREALVITDAIEDMDLLEKSGRPLRTVWPGAYYRKALSEVYLPGQYISQIKRPGERYILRGIIQEDFAFWVLCSIGLASNPVAHIGGLLLLLISFWAIYERGYVDNDLSAARYEADPKLSHTFGIEKVATPAVQPWIWALAAGAVGVGILHQEPVSFGIHYGLWAAALVVLYSCYKLYNRIDKKTRVWLYPFLQLARCAAFMIVVPIEPAGIAALSAHMFSRWVPYQIYRLTSSNWPDTYIDLVRLVAFVLMLAIVVAALGVSVMLTWGTLALLAWTVFRARRDLRSVFGSSSRIDATKTDGGR